MRGLAKILIFTFLYTFAGLNLCRAAQGDKLIVSENQLKLNGKNTILRGVAMGDPYSRLFDYNRDSLRDYAEIKKWRANVVRLSVHPGNWLRDNKKTRYALEKEIAFARKTGLIVMVDWHVIGWPDGWFKTTEQDVKGYTFESDMIYAKDFWQYMARRYKNDQGVIFELWNEPMDQENEMGWSELRPSMQTLYELVRRNGAKNVVVVPGTRMATDLRGIREMPIKGSDIMYSWHSYPDNVLKKDWYRAFANLNDRYPVMLAEWGYSLEPGANDYVLEKNQRYYEPMVRLIKEKKLNFTAWCWHGSWQPALVKKDWQTPTEWGKLLKKLLSEYKK